MRPGRIEIVHNFTGETGYIILVFRKTSAPLAEATGYITGSGLGAQNGTTSSRAVYPAPHSQESLVIEDLDPVMYNITAYRSIDGVALDQQINILACDAKLGAKYGITRLEYVVDRGDGEVGVWADPIAGDTGIRDTRLADGNYWVEERGTGSFLTTEILDRSDVGGGFDFTTPGKIMFTTGIYIVYLQTRSDIDGSGSGSGSGDVRDDLVILDADKNYDAALHNGKTFYSRGSGASLKLVVALLATQPDSFFYVVNQEGSQNYTDIQLDVGDTVKFLNRDLNRISLAKGEGIKILIKNNEMFVLNYNGQASLRGDIEPSYGPHSTYGNRLSADGSTGVLNADDWTGLWDVINELPAGSVTTLLLWSSDKRKYGVDSVARQFRVPDLTDMHVRFRNGDNAGAYQSDQLGQYTDTVGNSEGGTDPITVDQYTNSGGTHYSFRNKTRNAGQETRVKAFKQYPTILL